MLTQPVHFEKQPLHEVIERVCENHTEVPLVVSDLFDDDRQQSVAEQEYTRQFRLLISRIDAMLATAAVVNDRCATWRTSKGKLHLSLYQEDKFLPFMLMLSCEAE